MLRLSPGPHVPKFEGRAARVHGNQREFPCRGRDLARRGDHAYGPSRPKLARRIEAIYEDKLDGKIDEAFYTRKTDEYRAEQARLAEEIGRQQQAGPPQVENLAELATRAAERFEQQPAHEKRKLLRYIVEDCQWTQGHLTYRWKPPFERAVRGEQEQMLRAA
jgi:hypothetical protein